MSGKARFRPTMSRLKAKEPDWTGIHDDVWAALTQAWQDGDLEIGDREFFFDVWQRQRLTLADNKPSSVTLLLADGRTERKRAERLGKLDALTTIRLRRATRYWANWCAGPYPGKKGDHWFDDRQCKKREKSLKKHLAKKESRGRDMHGAHDPTPKSRGRDNHSVRTKRGTLPSLAFEDNKSLQVWNSDQGPAPEGNGSAAAATPLERYRRKRDGLNDQGVYFLAMAAAYALGGNEAMHTRLSNAAADLNLGPDEANRRFEAAFASGAATEAEVLAVLRGSVS